ncbi:MAG TPA: hypothetical protein VGD84_04385, partial [Pseudonocardiaceae bacterium]
MTPTRNRTTRPRSSGRLAASPLTAVLTALLAVLTILGAALPAAAAQRTDTSPTTATFGVQPATGDKPDARARLTYSATPGAQISDHVAIQNFGTAPLQLHVYANDAFNTADGGFDIQAAA